MSEKESSLRDTKPLPNDRLSGDSKPMAERVVSNLRDLRTRDNLTQAQIADIVGVTRQTIIAIEKGNYTPSILLALKLARALGVTVEELFDYVE